jgi:hypothetical protein
MAFVETAGDDVRRIDFNAAGHDGEGSDSTVRVRLLSDTGGFESIVSGTRCNG